jgi:hypothetical protein
MNRLRLGEDGLKWQQLEVKAPLPFPSLRLRTGFTIPTQGNGQGSDKHEIDYTDDERGAEVEAATVLKQVPSANADDEPRTVRRSPIPNLIGIAEMCPVRARRATYYPSSRSHS